MSKDKKTRRWTDNLFSPREALRIQERREEVNYQFKEDISAIEEIRTQPYREIVTISI